MKQHFFGHHQSCSSFPLKIDLTKTELKNGTLRFPSCITILMIQMSYGQYSWLITINRILMDGMTINHIVSIDHGSYRL
jgi:hypothetical protein